MSWKLQFRQLAGREYLPMVATIAFWAIAVVAIGHADTARLLAASTAVRAIQLLTKLATSLALKRRLGAPRPIRRQAQRFAFNLQAAALATALLLVALLTETLKSIDQLQIAAFLPFIALGMPARYLRYTDVRTSSPYFRLALTVAGLAMVSIAWAANWPVALFGFAFGAREWVAYAVLRWWPRNPRPPKTAISDPLHFDEVAFYSAILGRRLLTYRLTKSLLTVFGPVGNVAARTGRGLNLHKKLEPYLPHHLGGFIAFSLTALGAAGFLAVRSGEPAAMVGAAGLAQIGCAAANVILLWRWLPAKGGEPLYEDDDDEE